MCKTAASPAHLCAVRGTRRVCSQWLPCCRFSGYIVKFRSASWMDHKRDETTSAKAGHSLVCALVRLCTIVLVIHYLQSLKDSEAVREALLFCARRAAPAKIKMEKTIDFVEWVFNYTHRDVVYNRLFDLVKNEYRNIADGALMKKVVAMYFCGRSVDFIACTLSVDKNRVLAVLDGFRYRCWLAVTYLTK